MGSKFSVDNEDNEFDFESYMIEVNYYMVVRHYESLQMRIHKFPI